jgi:hypothetical protein
MPITAFPLHLKVKDIREAIEGYPDEATFYLAYGEVETENIFARVDGLTRYTPEDGNDTPGPLITISLMDESAPHAGEHCPDDNCPGVIDEDGDCSHCGIDYQDLEEDDNEDDDR